MANLSEKAKGKQRADFLPLETRSPQTSVPTNLVFVIRFTDGSPDLRIVNSKNDTISVIQRSVSYATKMGGLADNLSLLDSCTAATIF